MSAFLDLANAVKSALLTPTQLASGFVNVGRLVPLPAGKTQGIWIRPARASGEAPFSGDSRVDWGTDLIVALAARGAAGADGIAAVDALLDQVYARLINAAPPGSADAWTVRPQLAWDVDESETTVGYCELRVNVRHRTASDSLAFAT